VPRQTWEGKGACCRIRSRELHQFECKAPQNGQ
jgi:hypothetical protein